MSLRKIIKFFYMSFLFIILKINLFQKKTSQTNVRVLIFHGINNSDINRFQKIILNLSKNWNFITPFEFTSYMENKKKLIGNNLLISFDDGFKSSYYAYKKILEPLSIKAIFFITTDFLLCKNNFFKSKSFIFNNLKEKKYDYKILDDIFPIETDQIIHLICNQNLIGSHSKAHVNFNDISIELAMNDLEQSKKILKETVGSDISEFAFPFGSYKSINLNSLNSFYKFFERVYSGCRGNNKPNEKFIFRDTITIKEPLFYNEIYLSGIFDKIYQRNFYSFIKQK